MRSIWLFNIAVNLCEYTDQMALHLAGAKNRQRSPNKHSNWLLVYSVNTQHFVCFLLRPKFDDDFAKKKHILKWPKNAF